MKAGWVKRKLGEVTSKIGSGATPLGGEEAYKTAGIALIRSLNVYDDGFRDERLARIDDVQAAKLSNVIVDAGDVLLNITGASVARCCLAPAHLCPARVNQHVSIIRPIKQKLSSDLLHYLLISKIYKDGLLYAGEEGVSTRQAITKAQLQDFVIEYPESLSEQQRIVGILDAALDGIAQAAASAEQNLQNARALFDSHLQSVFTQRGEGWLKKRIEEIGTTQTGSTPKTSDKNNYGDFIPFIKPADFNADGSLNYENDGLSEQGFAQARKVSEGSVLMVCIGATIGKCGWCDRDVTTNQQTNSLTPAEGTSYKFIYYQMLTEGFQRRVIHSSGQATLPIINKSKWSALTVWLPPTLDEQELIVAKLDALREETQRLESLYRRKLAALAELKQSLLHQAFSGML